MAGDGKLMEVTLTGALGGQFVQNVLHAQWEPEGEPDPFFNAVAVGVAVATDWQPAYLDCLSELYSMSSIRVRQLAPVAGPSYTQTSGVAGENGTRAGDFSVYVAGPLLNFPVTMGTPRVGKIFLPGVSEEDISEGILATPLDTVLNAFIAILLTPIAVSGDYPGTLTYCVAKTDHSDWKIPVGGYISATVGTQRRRAKPNY